MLKLSPSSIKTWQECSRKYQYKYFNKRQAKNDTGAQSFGKAFHHGLDDYWQHKNPRSAVKAAIDNVEGMKQKILAEVLMLGYNSMYKHDGFTFISAESEQMVEGYEKIANLVGIWDKLARDPDGRLVLVDHKTTRADIKSESPYWTRIEQEDTQIDFYFLMAAELGIEIEYVMYDVIRVPRMNRLLATPPDKLKRYKRNSKYGKIGDVHKSQRQYDESWEDFRQRVIKYCAKNQKNIYVRSEIYRTRADIDRMRSDIRGLVHQIDAADATFCFGNELPRSLGACYNYNSECEFAPVCRNETTLWNKELYEDKE